MKRRPGKAGDADRAELAGAWCLRLAERELSAPERAEFDAWLAADPANAGAFDAATRAWQALDQARLSPELIALRRGALESFRRGHAARWRRGGHRRRGIAALAACLVVAALGAGLWFRYAPRSYETGLGERRVVTLSDGSRVSLDASSKLKVRYGGGRRALWLERGRAKFAVARDPLRPFSVGVADKLVIATGTEFSVELLSSQVHVILYEGSVEVLASGRGGTLQPVRLTTQARASGPDKPAATLTPGRGLVAEVAAADALVTAVDPVRSLWWEAGQLVFSDEPLASAVERMNRYAAVPLAVGDAAAGQVRISGVYVAGDTQAFVEGITGVFPVTARELDGRTLLVSRR